MPPIPLQLDLAEKNPSLLILIIPRGDGNQRMLGLGAEDVEERGHHLDDNKYLKQKAHYFSKHS